MDVQIWEMSRRRNESPGDRRRLMIYVDRNTPKVYLYYHLLYAGFPLAASLDRIMLVFSLLSRSLIASIMMVSLIKLFFILVIFLRIRESKKTTSIFGAVIFIRSFLWGSFFSRWFSYC